MEETIKNTKEYIKEALGKATFGVLSTEGDGQPHASLIAVSMFNEVNTLLFATYKQTLKYENLAKNNRVSLLFDNRSLNLQSSKEITVITAFGTAKEILPTKYADAIGIHLTKHPDLQDFLNSPKIALFEINVSSYQIVQGIDNVVWWNVK